MIEEFDAFAARKQKAALAAWIPGYRTVGSQGYTVGLEKLGNGWTSARFDGPFFASPPSVETGLPAVNTVFVQSADGNTGTRRPSDLGGGETDAHLIYEGLSRVRADAVMTGATTIQGSQTIFSVWHPELVRLRAALGLPRHPAQIVATVTGKLGIEAELLFNVPQMRVFILTTPSGAAALAPRVEERSWITVLASAEKRPLVDNLRRLRADYGIQRVSCIGGRTLATELIDAGAVQDIYLTTSPHHGGEPGTPFYTGPGPLNTTTVVKKAGCDEESGVVFEHLRLAGRV